MRVLNAVLEDLGYLNYILSLILERICRIATLIFILLACMDSALSHQMVSETMSAHAAIMFAVFAIFFNVQIKNYSPEEVKKT